jgi:hypothetical protein
MHCEDQRGEPVPGDMWRLPIIAGAEITTRSIASAVQLTESSLTAFITLPGTVFWFGTNGSRKSLKRGDHIGEGDKQ